MSDTSKPKISTDNASIIEEPNSMMSLADHLRQVPGVRVTGTGRNASVTIRGGSSINGSNEPLFVVNGQEFSGGLEAVSNFIDVNEIAKIRVLKDPGDTGMYGVRGANGVIEIYLKG